MLQLKYISFLFPLLSLTSCTIDCFDYSDQTESNKPAVDGEEIVLRISRPGDAPLYKAPTGGQKGDGFLKGNQWSDYLKDVDYDYKLDDLCVFIYESDRADALNSSSSIEFIHKIYVTKDQLTVHFDREDDTHPGHDIDAYYTSARIALDGYRKRGNHHIAVVANVGDITNKVSTLGELRDYISNQPSFTHEGTSSIVYADCVGDAATHHADAAGGQYSRFAMGLYEEPTWIDGTSNGSENTPHVAVATLERLAARIDFVLNQFPDVPSQKADAYAPIPYDVEVGGDVLSRNWVTHVRLVNVKQTPSYLMRRTAFNPRANSTGSTVKYLGEEVDNNGVSANYILTPNTSSPLKTYFGTTALDAVRERDFSQQERVVSRKAYAPYNGSGYVESASAMAFSGTSDNYFIIGYAEENTLPTDMMTRDYTTGILLRSVFEPSTIYRLNDAGTGYVEDKAPLTTNVLSNGTAPAGYEVGRHYGITFWMMERLVPNPTEADRLYLVGDTEEDIRTLRSLLLQDADNQTTGWTVPVKFEDGIAYNYYWIRHSNSQGNGHPFTPMEYSIVRNNIYGFSISSFSGPGAPSTDPALENPDHILPISYVHKWHPYTVEEVGM